MSKDNVIDLNRSKTPDVATMLRDLADSIESEKMPVRSWAVVCIVGDHDHVGLAWEAPESTLSLLGGIEMMKSTVLANDGPA